MTCDKYAYDIILKTYHLTYINLKDSLRKCFFIHDMFIYTREREFYTYIHYQYVTILCPISSAYCIDSFNFCTNPSHSFFETNLK